jgi:very-short-patch-repair endonuclease
MFDCEECGHELLLTANNIANGQWCSYCNKDKLCDKEDCLFCFQKSFASQPMASMWSTKNDRTTRMICSGSEKKCWFDCDTCHHSFQSVLYTIKKDTFCPYCSNQRLCEEECTYCFEKSCASHQMIEAWSTKNVLQPRQVFLQSNKKMIFNCVVCYHEYETTVIGYFNSIHGSCHYCSNHKLCNQDCIICFNKSFASHPKVDCWSIKNTKQPREVFKGSEQRVIFNCDICHSEFDTKVYNVLTGYWCPYCKNKSEAKMLAFLSNIYPDCKKQLRFEWCRFSITNNIMPFDFGIGKILIELDGEQHFTQISNWDTPKNVQVKDKEKIQKCMEQGYSIIHISQLDVWFDYYDWKKVLQEEISLLQHQPPTCVFISSENIYENHCNGIKSCKIVHPLKMKK